MLLAISAGSGGGFADRSVDPQGLQIGLIDVRRLGFWHLYKLLQRLSWQYTPTIKSEIQRFGSRLDTDSVQPCEVSRGIST